MFSSSQPDRQGAQRSDSGLGFSESTPDVFPRDLVKYDT